jgi:spore maturation protein CgeB
MKILLVAINRVPHLGVSFNAALQQLGHEVKVIDQRWAYSPLDRWPFRKFVRRITGDGPSARKIFGMLVKTACANFRPDILLSTGGGQLDRELLQNLRGTTKARLIMYSTDHPFNPVVSGPSVVEALPAWDVVATPRKATIDGLRRHCAGEVVYLPFGYDPALHHPEMPSNEKEDHNFRSDAVFMGGCDHDRVPYLDPLAQAEDLSVSMYGGYYRHTPALRKCNKGIAYGRDYRLVLNTTSVALCLVRRANADGHVMRTFEIPACGAFMLAERTDEHEEMFREDRDAAFFSSPEELLDKTRFYVRHENLRREIAGRGFQTVTGMRNTYKDRLAELLTHSAAAPR